MAGVKVLVLAALLLLVVASAAASRSEESCKKVNLKPCEKHIMQRIEQDEDEDQDHLKMRGIHYRIRRSSGEEEEEDEEEERDQWKKCCKSLRNLDSKECQCRALNKIMENQSEKIEGKQQMKDMKRELLSLPLTCGLPPLFDCELDH